MSYLQRALESDIFIEINSIPSARSLLRVSFLEIIFDG